MVSLPTPRLLTASHLSDTSFYSGESDVDIQDSVRGKNVYIVQVRRRRRRSDLSLYKNVLLAVQRARHKQPSDGTAALCSGRSLQSTVYCPGLGWPGLEI